MKILFEIVADQSQAALAIEQLRNKIKELRKELRQPGIASERVAELNKEIAKTGVEIGKLTEQQKNLNREFKAAQLPKDSLAGIRIEYAKLTEQVAKLSKAERESNFGQALIKKSAALKSQINDVEQSLGRFTGQVGNYRIAALKLGDIVTGGLITGGVFALLEGVRRLGAQVISVNAEVSDKIADVAKAANTSIAAVERLSDRLENRQTRTSLVDQLGIAEIGGKLGVAEKDLFNFVDAVDVVNVALGDQFGGNVEATTDVLGKLRNVLLDIKSGDIGKDILNIGNAINVLESQGAAGGASIADITSRIAGLGQQFGVSSGQLLGIASTIDEVGILAERGSTAYVRLLQRVAETPELFAKVAKVPADEFKKLVNDDIFGAVNLFLEKLNDRNLSNTELQKVLNDLKLEGVGVSELVGKLGGDMGLLTTRVAQATEALGNNDSVLGEFEKRNQTAGASVERLSNAFSNLLTDGAISEGLADIIDLLTQFLEFIRQDADKLFDWAAATDGMATANEILAESLDNATDQIVKETVATEKNFGILKNEKASRDQRNGAIQDLIKLYPTILNQQQLEKASIEELELLQVGLTSTLREQIIERQKLRAKEAIETEIVQKRLRQVELEATPDRALLGELTAGETFRNFGTLDPKKLRTNLKQQFDSDIAELEASLKTVDRNFAGLRSKAEDNLSAAEQDELDLRRQFADRASGLASNADKASGVVKNLGKSAEEAGDISGKAGRKAKKAAEEQNEALAAQIQRINELRNSIRDFDASTILNQFDRQITELEIRRDEALAQVEGKRSDLKIKVDKQGGVATAQDIKEGGLLSEQEASIKASFKKQIDAVSEARQEAVDKQKEELAKAGAEVEQLAKQNAERLAQVEASLFGIGIENRQTELKQGLDARISALKQQLISGEITQKEFQDRSLEAQAEYNQKSLDLEKEKAAAAVQFAEAVKKTKIEAAKATLDAQLQGIQADRNADVSQITEQAQSEGTDAAELIAARDKKAAEERKTAYLEYADAVNEANNELEQTQISTLDAINEKDKEVQDDKLARLEKEKAKREELQQFLLSSAEAISGAFFDIERNRVEKETETKLSALDAEYQKKIEKAKGNDAQIAKLEKERDTKRAQIEKQAANERKRIAIKEAIIQGALAVIEALPNLFAAAAAAIATAAQVAVISSQTFERGGVVKLGTPGRLGGQPHSRGGTKGVFSDGTQVEMEKDELLVVLNKRSARKIKHLSDLNADGGGVRFERGGLLGTNILSPAQKTAFRRVHTFQQGGSLAVSPQLAIPGQSGSGGAQTIVVDARATFTEDEIKFMAKTIADQVGAASRLSIAEGLDDANRLNERTTSMAKNREA